MNSLSVADNAIPKRIMQLLSIDEILLQSYVTFRGLALSVNLAN